MTAIVTCSSREFNQDVSAAKRAAAHGPVFITDRGRPAHVLLSIEDYRRLAGQPDSIVDALACDDAGAIEFDPAPLRQLVKPADLG